MSFDRWAIVEGWYWFCVNYHTGQWSWLYRRFSRICRYYTPGIMSNGPSTEEAQFVYDNLVKKFGD